VLLRLLVPRVFQRVQAAVEERHFRGRGVQGQRAEAFAGQDGVLVFAQCLLEVLHRGREGDGVLAEGRRDRLPGIAGLLGGLACVVQQLVALGAGGQ
jgi:hypothetical protein